MKTRRTYMVIGTPATIKVAGRPTMCLRRILF